MNLIFRIIWAYLKIGLFGFGGGYAMLTLIEREIVGTGWISNTTFTDIVAISQMTPGPIGINSATYIGYTIMGGGILGVLGSIIATATVVIPPFILILYTSHLIQRHKDSAVVQGALQGLRPIVVGLIASAALLLMNTENFGYSSQDWFKTIPICIGAFCINYFTKIHSILVIILAGIVGLILF